MELDYTLIHLLFIELPPDIEYTRSDIIISDLVFYTGLEAYPGREHHPIFSWRVCIQDFDV